MSKKFISKVKKIASGNLPAIISCLLFIIAGIVVCLNRYWQYDVFYHDFGIFDSAIWRASRFQAPTIDHLLLGGKWIFADHFNPSIFLISPLYWLTGKSEMLLVVQVLAVGISGYILYLIGKEILRNSFESFAVMWCYYLFLGLQNALITDFHEVTVMVLPLTLVFYAFIKKKTFWYFLFLLITLGFKESTFLLGIGIGIAIFFLDRKWWKINLLTIFISIIWGIVAIKIIIPYFSSGIYLYNPRLPSGIDGIIFSFVDNEIKRTTLLYSFGSFGFLSFFSPQFYFLIFQDLIVRFLPNIPARWGLGFHYSIQLAPLLALSSVYGLKRIKRIKIIAKYSYLIAILLLINAFFLFHFKLHGPFGLAYNKAFYAHTKDFVFLDDLLHRVPKDARIMTQNNLATRFTHGDVWVLVDNYGDRKPEYIILDLREGQNPNNFYGVVRLPKLVQYLKKDPDYKQIYATKEQFIYKRVTK